jgi:DNA-binding MarR family transcriptional regulator
VSTTSVDPRLASQLRIAVVRLARRLRRERSDNSLTPTQISALATLDRQGPMTLGELAALEYVQPPSMTRVVAGLEALELVRRTPHPRDGRQILLDATDAGRKLLAVDRERRDAWLCHRLKELTPEERVTLREAALILERVAQS